jgi:hypothetical protein
MCGVYWKNSFDEILIPNLVNFKELLKLVAELLFHIRVNVFESYHLIISDTHFGRIDFKI